MNNGATVAAFERAFAEYVGAEYAIALCNGTATLHTALVALGVCPGDRVAVPPLTMSATTLAVLHAGATPLFTDVDPDTWLMTPPRAHWLRGTPHFSIPVSLYGLYYPQTRQDREGWTRKTLVIDDAAQTLRPHNAAAAFTSYSFQASKILALGEGGMLATNDAQLARRAREFSSLGYQMRADQPRIDPAVLKASTYARHHWRVAYNYRMNDLTAQRGLDHLVEADIWIAGRRRCAELYRKAIAGCDWLTPQHVLDERTHDYWAFAVACDTPERARCLQVAMAECGGEIPYAAWRLTYHEPAFRSHAPNGSCPVAESLQPRILQFQTNTITAAARNADALRRAIQQLTM